MMLLERQEPLDRLRREHERATSDCGRTVLISGEAGIGKTSLIEEFTRTLPEEFRILRGGCEA
ncbi:MAG: ATP-binding protein, partial [Lysobacterales bacterium]